MNTNRYGIIIEIKVDYLTKEDKASNLERNQTRPTSSSGRASKSQTSDINTLFFFSPFIQLFLKHQ
ncbi:MAG: hypothetical protein JWP81_2365 [Ferruginibacter sp.]|nr:hypothetical protein [Ferruginibacter sp.]